MSCKKPYIISNFSNIKVKCKNKLKENFFNLRNTALQKKKCSVFFTDKKTSRKLKIQGMKRKKRINRSFPRLAPTHPPPVSSFRWEPISRLSKFPRRWRYYKSLRCIRWWMHFPLGMRNEIRMDTEYARIRW